MLWAFRGDDINCGCFGSYILLTPSESLVKNAFLILVNLFALKTTDYYSRKLTWVYPALGVIAIVLPFVLNVVELDRQHPDETTYPYPFPVEHLDSEYLEKAEVSFEKGEYLLGFMSLNCAHCKVAAQKLGIAQRKYKLPPVKMFFLGSEKEVAPFFKEANASFDYVLFNNNGIFKITTGTFPTVIYVKNGEVHKLWYGSELSYSEMENLSKTIYGYN